MIGDCAVSEFAPAERDAPEDLERQRGYFSDAWFFGELLHYVPEMVTILNRRRQIVYANQATLATVGASDGAAVVGKRPGELFRCVHAAGPGGCGTTRFCRYCGAVDAILRSQAGRSAVEECRITVTADHAEESLDLRVWASPMAVRGEPFTFFAITDIADEKQRSVLERIFLHDLLNTAQVLRGFSQLVGARAVDDATRGEFVERIAVLSDRIIDEINAHRQLLAAEHGELRPVPQPVDARALVRGLVDAYGRPEDLDLRLLRVAGGDGDVMLESDPTLLRRVVGNMVKNALEASAPGEMVTVGCRRAAEGVVFWVHNAAHMPEHVRLQVFQRSFSTKGVGRGLGTYSMKYLTEKCLGGAIAFTSSEAEGTTFVATVPLALPPPPP